jgi:hypothetical protein
LSWSYATKIRKILMYVDAFDHTQLTLLTVFVIWHIVATTPDLWTKTCMYTDTKCHEAGDVTIYIKITSSFSQFTTITSWRRGESYKGAGLIKCTLFGIKSGT